MGNSVFLNTEARLKILESKLRADVEQSEPPWEASSYAQVMRYRCQRAAKLSENKVVLDLCCGTGWCTHEISKVAKLVVGIDKSHICTEYAALKYRDFNIKFLDMNALELGLSEGVFDLFVMCEVIEHFTTQEASKLLTKIKKVLKEDGAIYGTTSISPPEKTLTLLKENRFHKHLYQRVELASFLGRYFNRVLVDKVMPMGDSFCCEFFLCQD